jgi:hypothetical protein
VFGFILERRSASISESAFSFAGILTSGSETARTFSEAIWIAERIHPLFRLGLITAGFLTPQYDITFSLSAEGYKRRGRREVWVRLVREGRPNEPYGSLW